MEGLWLQSSSASQQGITVLAEVLPVVGTGRDANRYGRTAVQWKGESKRGQTQKRNTHAKACTPRVATDASMGAWTLSELHAAQGMHDGHCAVDTTVAVRGAGGVLTRSSGRRTPRGRTDGPAVRGDRLVQDVEVAWLKQKR